MKLKIRHYNIITDLKNIFFEFNNTIILKSLLESFSITEGGPISPNLQKSPKKPTQFPDFQLKLFECQYRRMCRYRRMFQYRQIFLEIYILNYVVNVMNDVIIKFEFPKFTLSNYYMNSFDRVLHSTNYDDTLYLNLQKLL